MASKNGTLAPILRYQRPQSRAVVGGARRPDVGLAAFQQQREIALADGGVDRLFALLRGLRP